MDKEELLKEIMKLPKVETNNAISSMNSINVDDLMNAVDRLNKIPDYNDLLKENQESKKQLEETNKMIEKCGFVNIEQVMLNYCGLLTQRKEFILYLEDEIKNINPKEYDEEEIYRVYGYDEMVKYITLKEVLQKYKSIIGVSDDNKTTI